jgi:hypothetical protein
MPVDTMVMMMMMMYGGTIFFLWATTQPELLNSTAKLPQPPECASLGFPRPQKK